MYNYDRTTYNVYVVKTSRLLMSRRGLDLGVAVVVVLDGEEVLERQPEHDGDDRYNQ